ncbi:ABC transporter permease [Thermomicrobiaceae bacterium CFH 74404]|uniref:ABC transporter permease n=2 Tax=Thermomicrobia TaxID=189775 RepID=A0AA42B9B2_9BACT|nr:ABC transporter permease [Thermalbibacter longus]MCM8748276.1 ABC transporter permease [Thermalbibacter longus]
MPLGYLLRRLAVFLLIVWVAATVNFFIPRLSGADPVRERLLQMAAVGGTGTGTVEEVIKSYQAKFGLDKPLWQQYLFYLWDMARFDFGVSITRFPNSVSGMILDALPWTLVLVTIATLMAFAIGSLFGALVAWPRAPRFIHALAPPLLTLSAIPYYLLGLILVYFLAFTWRLFPLGGGYKVGSEPSWSWSFIQDAAYHSILPALSIILSGIGFWALSMRGMMITTQGEDYVTFAEAKGLRPRRIFLRYALRNAILPQTTALALALGHVVSGAVLVEIVFGYPGVGNLLYQAIRTFDYPIIYGVTFMVIVAIGLATLILDLLLPVLDPRITYQRS